MKQERKPKLGYDHIIPQRIRSLLDEHHESGAALARAIGKEPKTVNYIVLGVNGLSTDTLVSIAKHFDVSADYLLGLSAFKTANTDIRGISEYTGLTAESINALHYLNECSVKSLSLMVLNRVLEEYNDMLLKAEDFRRE